MKRVRIGTVGYLNAWPLTARLHGVTFAVPFAVLLRRLDPGCGHWLILVCAGCSLP